MLELLEPKLNQNKAVEPINKFQSLKSEVLFIKKTLIFFEQ